jgi:hypothetical protein
MNEQNSLTACSKMTKDFQTAPWQDTSGNFRLLFSFGENFFAFVIKLAFMVMSPVANMRGAGGRIGAECWGAGFIMRAALSLAGFRMSSFRIGHSQLNLIFLKSSQR